MLNLTSLKPQIDRVCSGLPVKRLGVFGSAITADFTPSSDIDLLVVFDVDDTTDLFDKYFELKESLEKLFGREVDLVVDKPFRNQVFRDAVERTRTVIYER